MEYGLDREINPPSGLVWTALPAWHINLGMHVTVRDAGGRIDPQNIDQPFHAFYVTRSARMSDIGRQACRSSGVRC
jgi:hypothetical protein